MSIEQATVRQISSVVCVIETDRGETMQFGEDHVVTGRFAELVVGQRVWFSREQARGPHPCPLTIRTKPPKETLECTADDFHTLDISTD